MTDDNKGRVDLSWDEAIKKALAGKDRPVHYADIAEEIASRNLRASMGFTPANTVNARISVSIQKHGVKSPFVRLGHGLYALRAEVEKEADPVAVGSSPEEDEDT